MVCRGPYEVRQITSGSDGFGGCDAFMRIESQWSVDRENGLCSRHSPGVPVGHYQGNHRHGSLVMNDAFFRQHHVDERCAQGAERADARRHNDNVEMAQTT